MTFVLEEERKLYIVMCFYPPPLKKLRFLNGTFFGMGFFFFFFFFLMKAKIEKIFFPEKLQT